MRVEPATMITVLCVSRRFAPRLAAPLTGNHEIDALNARRYDAATIRLEFWLRQFAGEHYTCTICSWRMGADAEWPELDRFAIADAWCDSRSDEIVLSRALRHLELISERALDWSSDALHILARDSDLLHAPTGESGT